VPRTSSRGSFPFVGTRATDDDEFLQLVASAMRFTPSVSRDSPTEEIESTLGAVFARDDRLANTIRVDFRSIELRRPRAYPDPLIRSRPNREMEHVGTRLCPPGYSRSRLWARGERAMIFSRPSRMNPFALVASTCRASFTSRRMTRGIRMYSV